MTTSELMELISQYGKEREELAKYRLKRAWKYTGSPTEEQTLEARVRMYEASIRAALEREVAE